MLKGVSMLLEGKKVIITGGTRGIGFATVKRFLEEGAVVTLFGSRQESADKAVAKLHELLPGAEVYGRTVNLSDMDAVAEVFTAAAEQMGGLDCVVNNAGIAQRTALADYTAEEFQKALDLNVVAVFNGAKAAEQLMPEGGVILATSSMVGTFGQPAGVGYPTSKFAVNGLIRSLGRELGPKNIRVAGVAPGMIATDMVAALPQEIIDRQAAKIPMRRWGQPEDIANAFVFLASDLAAYVTGTVLAVDGAAMNG